MKPRVFISKALETTSFFQQQLVEAGWTVVGEFLLDIQAVHLADLPACDWIFFYSKRAVHFLLDQFELPTDVQIATIGPGTARQVRKRGYPVHFTGTGNPSNTATQFAKQAAGCTVFFPRAEHSRMSVQQLLADQIKVIDRIVYRNPMRHDFDIPPCSYLVFTSPRNAQAYYQRYPVDPQQRVIAIGPTTAQKLAELGVQNSRTSSAPTEEKLAEVLLDWEKTQPRDLNSRKTD